MVGESSYKYDYFGIVVFFVIFVKLLVMFYVYESLFDGSIVY